MKVYKNDRTFLNIAILLFLPVGIVIFNTSDNGIIGNPYLVALIVDIFFYLMMAASCWDVYLEKDTFGFKNEWLFYWKNEYEFNIDDIERVKIIYHIRGTFIRVYWSVYNKKFHDIGVNRAKQLAQDLKALDIKVIELDSDDEFRNLFSSKRPED